MAPRNLQVNDAILAFEAASEKRPPAGWREPAPRASFTPEVKPFLTWIEGDRAARRRMHKLCKRINRMYRLSVKQGKTWKVFMHDLPNLQPYTNLKLCEELNWLNAQAVRYGLQPEMIQWQLLSAL